MVQIDMDNIKKLVANAEKQNINLSEFELINFVLTFEKIIQTIVLSNEEIDLKLTKEHKLSAKFKRYHKDKDAKLIVNMKRTNN